MKKLLIGTALAALLSTAAQAEWHFSYDMLGEGARTQADADNYFASYANAIDAIGKLVSPWRIIAERCNNQDVFVWAGCFKGVGVTNTNEVGAACFEPWHE